MPRARATGGGNSPTPGRPLKTLLRKIARWTWLALAAWQWLWLFAWPGGPRSAWLAAVASLPVLALLAGVWRLQPRSLVWAGFLALPYFLVGVMEAWSNPPQRIAALIQVALSGGFLVLVSAAARWRRLG